MPRKPEFVTMRTLRTPLLAAAAILFVVFAIPSAGAEVSENTEHITVTQELLQETDDLECIPSEPGWPLVGWPPDGITWSRQSTPSTFEIVVTLARPLCEPIEAAAVIYEMPDTDPRWPQTLAEKVDITFLEAGETTIVWEKYCVPAQFDLLEPPTPAVINSGLDHGPLLFLPTNDSQSNGSATQYIPTADENCEPDNTTTSSSSIPDEPTSTPTTQPSVLASTTTLVESSPTSGGANPTTVGGVTATNSSGGAPLSVAG